MGQRTLLYDLHLALGAKTVDFGGWDMPLHYGSQVEEHHQVRSDCGVFDVSHMTVIDVDGTDATVWLQRLLANDVARLDDTGKALYSPLLNEQGGVIDDLIVYRTETGYRLVNNAATRAKVLDWLQSQRAGFSVDFQVRPDLAILAIQGPRARERSRPCSAPRAQLLSVNCARLKALPTATGSLPAPAIPVRTAWRSFSRAIRRWPSSTTWSAPVLPQAAWAPAIPCAWKPA